MYYISSAIINNEDQSWPGYTETDGKSHVCPRDELANIKSVKTGRKKEGQAVMKCISESGCECCVSVCPAPLADCPMEKDTPWGTGCVSMQRLYEKTQGLFQA